MLNNSDYERMKKRIRENIDRTFDEFEGNSLFLRPEIAYFDAKADIFDKMAEKGISESLKRIYRAGKTLIVFTLPYSDQVKEDEQWKDAYEKSVHLLMKLNSSIKSALKEWGRVTSSLNTPMDWNEEEARESWSHRAAGVICGLGRQTAAGLFIDNNGRFARVSGVVTDCSIAGRFEGDSDLVLEKVVERTVTLEEIGKCPCSAITAEGFDAFKCQGYCRGIHVDLPSPEVCAKCIR